jgi:hypothetical protein
MAGIQLRKHVFVSYSHRDRDWLERLKIHLTPYLHGEGLHLWDDSRIAAGATWAQEIERELDGARAAVLLVSPDFLASDYINSVELPNILARAKSDLIVLWIPVAPSAYQATPLREFQAVVDPSKPLTTLSKAKQELALVEIAKRISSAMDVNAIGNALRVIDAFTPEVNAFVTGQAEPTQPPQFAVRAEQTAQALNLVDHGYSRKLVDIDDLQRLDTNSQKLIRAYERTMKELFERWTELKVKRIAQDPDTRAEAVEQSKLVRHDLCSELTELLAFIESMGMSLQDHYQHVRFICRQPGQ